MTRPGFRLALLATLLALFVVLLGAYTRLTHAGLGCPDWPGCYGFISVPSNDLQLAHAELYFPDTPVHAAKGWSEMLHRYFAGALALLILLLAGQAWRRRRQTGQPLKLPFLLLGVVLAQATFGMWTVTLKLWPQVVTAHLLGGVATLSLLFLLTLRLSGAFAVRPQLPAKLQRMAAIGLLLVTVQIALGGWVSANYAALACTDVPTCQGQWWPDADFANGFHLAQHIGPNYLGGKLDSEARTAIHLTHRVGALLVTLSLLSLAWQLKKSGLMGMAALLVTLLAMQISLGVSNVLFHLPLLTAIAHSACGAGLMVSMVMINYRVRAPVVQRPHIGNHPGLLGPDLSGKAAFLTTKM
ncbi:COX15/CtaA family protein [Pseudomonas caspiana]|uniref:Cytochrome B n=1 Tax=Pseudomonas caspiana TaxID=1451454 RepID=A0A1Y3P0S0_9PSED|nr:COX15/CtaA family protein [Pseudomonas caspiana]OUM72091.1 cytochrome B [Pseudomonas caspiana]